MRRILVTGSKGQIGSELVDVLSDQHGPEAVVASDLRPDASVNGTAAATFVQLDVTDREALRETVERYDVGTVFHLASLLSAVGERQPDTAWKVNVEGLRNVLDLAREHDLRVFWPSSIAVFGSATPLENTPQTTVLDPTTMYGVTKVSGELLCRYHHLRYGTDVRSLRYPGLISYAAEPGGGTTDYAVHIFYAAVREEPYVCFLRPETRLPMMYMPDAVRAACDLMTAPSSDVGVRTSYNVTAMSFSAQQLAEAIQRQRPGFEIRYEPDERQRIADTWPSSIDDSVARAEWGWAPRYDLDAMVQDMLTHLEARLEQSEVSS